jgi:hypothetical protein
METTKQRAELHAEEPQCNGDGFGPCLLCGHEVIVLPINQGRDIRLSCSDCTLSVVWGMGADDKYVAELAKFREHWNSRALDSSR